MSYKPKAAEFKKTVVNDFVKLMTKYPIIAAINMEGLPTPQLQNMRAKLRDRCILRMTKRRLIKIALDKAKNTVEGIEQIEQYLRGMPALLFTDQNPFSLYKTLEKSKSSAPAKAGQIAPKDVIVPAGSTPFAPGPVIGELGSLGIKSGVEAGKIVIKEDKLLVKEGEAFTDKQASILGRLGIKPMEIGLNIVAVFENGTIYTKKILAVDEKEYIANIVKGHSWAFNLAFEAGYTTKDNIEQFVTKAFNDSKALAREANILADAIVGELVEKAERQMLSLKNTANIQTEAPKKSSKEEKKEGLKLEKKSGQPADYKEEGIPSAEDLIKQTKEAFKNGKKVETKDDTPTASDLLAEAESEKKTEPEKVPTAHELLEKKKKEQNK